MLSNGNLAVDNFLDRTQVLGSYSKRETGIPYLGLRGKPDHASHMPIYLYFLEKIKGIKSPESGILFSNVNTLTSISNSPEKSWKVIDSMLEEYRLSSLIDSIRKEFLSIKEVLNIEVKNEGKKASLSIQIEMPKYNRKLMKELIGIEKKADALAWKNHYELEYFYIPSSFKKEEEM